MTVEKRFLFLENKNIHTTITNEKRIVLFGIYLRASIIYVESDPAFKGADRTGRLRLIALLE